MRLQWLGILVVALSGCAVNPQSSVQSPVRWQVVPLGNESGAILVDTHTGETWRTLRSEDWQAMQRS